MPNQPKCKRRFKMLVRWGDMKRRCFDKNNKSYRHYGGRGITVCDRWLVFQNFLDDMGLAPPGMSLDRIDNDGGYSPENCRWADRKTQGRNTRQVRFIEFRGIKKCVAEWAEDLGVGKELLYRRIELGWTVEKTLTTPLIKKYSHRIVKADKVRIK